MEPTSMRSYSRRNVLAFGAIAGTAWLGSTPARADDSVAIGFAGPMTGPVAAFGNEIKRGIDLAIDAVNAKGGVRGRNWLSWSATTNLIRSRRSAPIAT